MRSLICSLMSVVLRVSADSEYVGDAGEFSLVARRTWRAVEIAD